MEHFRQIDRTSIDEIETLQTTLFIPVSVFVTLPVSNFCVFYHFHTVKTLSAGWMSRRKYLCNISFYCNIILICLIFLCYDFNEMLFVATLLTLGV